MNTPRPLASFLPKMPTGLFFYQTYAPEKTKNKKQKTIQHIFTGHNKLLIDKKKLSFSVVDNGQN